MQAMERLPRLAQPVLSTMMFNAAFPLGVEDGVMRHKYQFAIKNSGLNRKAHKENSAVTLSCLVRRLWTGSEVKVTLKCTLNRSVNQINNADF